jgi:hypothetical protein
VGGVGRDDSGGSAVDRVTRGYNETVQAVRDPMCGVGESTSA